MDPIWIVLLTVGSALILFIAGLAIYAIIQANGELKLSQTTPRYPCPCCGYLTMESEHWSSFDVCPVCYWEDDDQSSDPNMMSDANGISLNQARQNFIAYGAVDTASRGFVRKPRASEIPLVSQCHD